MSYRNFINLENSELDKNIFRVMTVDRLFDLFQDKRNSLSHPSKWDDPFENRILNGVIKSDDGKSGNFAMRNNVFGQSWSFKYDSDAMWRIYAPNKDGVTVRSNIRKLHESLHKKSGEFPELRCFIGRVKYFRPQAISSEFEKIDLLNTNGSGIAESLLVKRTAFIHESEVRLIFAGRDYDKVGSDYFTYEIDPFSLFDAVYFDPRMSSKLYEVYRKEILNMGFKGKVVKSTLYDPPKQFVYKL